jgi:hypothetical protein
MSTSPSTTKPAVKVYVRLDARDSKYRTVAFTIPSDVSATQLLFKGYAIDGDAAVRRVPLHPTETDEGLYDVEFGLVQWLESMGYRVAFA